MATRTHTTESVSKTSPKNIPTTARTKTNLLLSYTGDSLFEMTIRNIATEKDKRMLYTSIVEIFSFKNIYPAKRTINGLRLNNTE